MVTAEQVGRDLHLHVEGVAEPFVVRPLPGVLGKELTVAFLSGSIASDGAGMEDVLRVAVDGGSLEHGRIVPPPVEEQHLYTRIHDELSLAEAESVLLPAFYFQTVLGYSGVQAYLEGGEGLSGQVKALRALIVRTEISPSTTSPSSESASPTSAASSPSTSSRRGGRTADRLPPRKRGFLRKAG